MGNKPYKTYQEEAIININENKRVPTFYGPLQVWPMVYKLYIGINLAIIMKQYGANTSQMCLALPMEYKKRHKEKQIRKLIQSPSKRRSDVTPGGAGQAPFRCNAGTKDFVSKEPP